MYHRIAELESDVWDLAVSPCHFREQLHVLKQHTNVIPLPQLVDHLTKNTLPQNCVCITFDDGYVDNYAAAKPLLEEYGLPATFFITSGNIGKTQEFWWDELEHLLLFSEQLPAAFSMNISGTSIQFDLGPEATLSDSLLQRHRSWRVQNSEAPSVRAQWYLRIWEALKPLPYSEQACYLAQLKDWANWSSKARENYRSMSCEELRNLSDHPLFTIGAHTVTHPALGYHAPEYQLQEIQENVQFLRAVTGKEVSLLAYPYGSHNGHSMHLAYTEGLKAAVTTEEKNVGWGSQPYALGRFQVQDLPTVEFLPLLQHWMKS